MSLIERKSAAIMFTDIAGYTSVMASDEQKALSLLQEKHSIIKPLIKEYGGIYVKGTGDGTLSCCDSDLKEKLFNSPLPIKIMKEWKNKLQ